MRDGRFRGLMAVAGLCVACGGVAAQVEAGGGQLRFEVFNPNTASWGSTYADAMAGEQIEWRVVASYVGTRTDLFAMGEVLYQPTISNADNVGVGGQADQIGAYRNGGNGGNSVAGSMLTQAEGNSTGALTSYGRVRFGGTACTATGSNTMTSFRHVGGSDGAPPGSWMRLAGNFVSLWPQPLAGSGDANAINRILRGISAQQQSQALAPAFHVAGTQDLVIFRQALILSDDAEVREVQFSTFNEAFRQMQGDPGPGGIRYMSWQTGAADSGSHRTGVTIVPATIWVNVPGPGGVAVVVASVLVACGRRRVGYSVVVDRAHRQDGVV